MALYFSQFEETPCWQESWCTCAGPSSLASPPLAHLIQSAVPKNHQNSFVVKNVFSGDSYLDENPVDVLYNLITTFSSQLILKNLSACFQHKVVSNMVSFEEKKGYRLILFREILNLREAGVLDRRLVCLIHNTKEKVSGSPEYHSVFVFL